MTQNNAKHHATNRQSLKIKTSIKTGYRAMQHNQGGACGLKIKTHVKAGHSGGGSSGSSGSGGLGGTRLA